MSIQDLSVSIPQPARNKFETVASKLINATNLNRWSINDHGKLTCCREERPLDDVIQDIREIAWLHNQGRVDIDLQATAPRAKERIEERKKTCWYQITAFFLSILNISTSEDEALQKVLIFWKPAPPTIPKPTSPPTIPKSESIQISQTLPTMSREDIEIQSGDDKNFDIFITLCSHKKHFITPLPVKDLQDSEIKNDFLVGPWGMQIPIGTVQLTYKLDGSPAKGTFMVLHSRQLVLLEPEDNLLSKQLVLLEPEDNLLSKQLVLLEPEELNFFKGYS